MKKRYLHGVGSVQPAGIILGSALALLLALGADASRSEASQYCYGCVLNGTQEVPSNASPALGGGQFLIHSAGFPGGEIRGQIMCFLNAPTSNAPDGSVTAAGLQLDRSEPNPFTQVTHIGFQLARSMPVELSLYDAQGRQIRTLVSGELAAGQHSLSWDGRDNAGRTVASGVYWYALDTPVGRLIHSVSLVR